MSYELINEQNVIDLVTEVGCQTSDSFSWNLLEAEIVKYLMAHSRPGCNCDDCSDETCPNADSDFDHWRQ